jgi:hypothetical protein
LRQKGRKVPELDDDNVRELALYPYRIIYAIKTAHIEILAVIHKRRNLRAEEIPRKTQCGVILQSSRVRTGMIHYVSRPANMIARNW